MQKLIRSDKTPLIVQIVATDENGLIGIDDKLPWGHVKEDMEFFKSMTLNHVVIMGYNTILSLPFKLPKRYMVGVSSRPCNDKTGTDVIFHKRVDNIITNVGLHSVLRQFNNLVDLEEPHDFNISSDIVYIAGGGQVYKSSLSETDVVFRNVIVKDKSIYPKGLEVYYPLDRLKLNFTLVSFEEIAIEGGYMVKEIWVKPR